MHTTTSVNEKKRLYTKCCHQSHNVNNQTLWTMYCKQIRMPMQCTKPPNCNVNHPHDDSPNESKWSKNVAAIVNAIASSHQKRPQNIKPIKMQNEPLPDQTDQMYRFRIKLIKMQNVPLPVPARRLNQTLSSDKPKIGKVDVPSNLYNCIVHGIVPSPTNARYFNVMCDSITRSMCTFIGGGWRVEGGVRAGWSACRVESLQGGVRRGWSGWRRSGVQGGGWSACRVEVEWRAGWRVECVQGGWWRVEGGGWRGEWRVEGGEVEGGWAMGGESNGPGQVKHPETQIFHTTSARDCRGRPPTYLNVVTVYNWKQKYTSSKRVEVPTCLCLVVGANCWTF